MTPIKFRSGELLTEESIWIANDNTPASTRPRKLLPIILPDIPTRLVGHNKVEEYTWVFIMEFWWFGLILLTYNGEYTAIYSHTLRVTAGIKRIFHLGKNI